MLQLLRSEDDDTDAADSTLRPTPGPAAIDELLASAERAGLSDAEIASRMILGEATVRTHVAMLLAKRGVRDRMQPVVLAYESAFIRPGEAST